jgi:hypothetical protein
LTVANVTVENGQIYTLSGVAPVLQELAKNIWTASVHHSFIGLHVGTRMTVIRLSSGKLLLHSPVATD